LQNTWGDRNLPVEGTAEKSDRTPAGRKVNNLGNDYDLSEFTATELDLWFNSIKAKRQWSDLNTLNYVRRAFFLRKVTSHTN